MKIMSKRLLAAAAVPALAFASIALAGGEGWTHDAKAAMKQAEAEDKDLLMDFTGSDWCVWCIRLNDEVFSTEEFKSFAPQHFVLVEFDFPRDKSNMSEETIEQNEKWKNKMSIQGYPTIILADAEGRPYAVTGYQRGGPDPYITHLTELMEIRKDRDKAFAKAETAEGLDKARALDMALDSMLGDGKRMDPAVLIATYEDTVNQIIKLDAGNEAGLRKEYEDMQARVKIQQKIDTAMGKADSDPEGAVKELSMILENNKDVINPEMHQQILATQSQIYMFTLNDKQKAEQLLREAIDVDPESQYAGMLKNALEQYFSDDDASDADADADADSDMDG